MRRKCERRLLDEAGIEIAGGFGPLAGKVFRIGVMGPLATEENVQFFLKEFGKALNAEGYSISGTHRSFAAEGDRLNGYRLVFSPIKNRLANRPDGIPTVTRARGANRMTLKSVETLLDVLHFADSHTAIIVPELGIRVTYDSLRQQVLAMANALASAGIRRGDAVAIALPNGLPAIVSFLAASIAGTAAPLNPAYPYEEFLFFLGDTDARVLLCPPVGAEFARSAAARPQDPGALRWK